MQIFGGRGYMRENAAERFFRELRVDRIWEGASEIQRLIIARALLKRGLEAHVGHARLAAGHRRRRIGAAGGVAGAAAAEEKVLNVFTWPDYIAPNTIADFEAEYGIKVNYDTYDSTEMAEARAAGGPHRLRRGRPCRALLGAADSDRRSTSRSTAASSPTGTISTRGCSRR